MIRKGLAIALLATLAACGRTEAPSAPSTPAAPAACNDLSINPAVSVSPGGAVTAATSETAAALLGGPIPPGTYDLSRVEQRGAPEWSDQRWESVQVGDSETGQTVEFAIARGAASNAPDRFSARVEEGPPARLVYTCGRTGRADIGWKTERTELHLLLPAEGAPGQTLHVFVRRGT